MFRNWNKRINQYYKDNAIKLQYVITENMIKICLSIIEKNTLEGDESVIFNLLDTKSMSSFAIVKKSKVISILNHLVEQDYIEKTGNGRGTKYQRW